MPIPKKRFRPRYEAAVDDRASAREQISRELDFVNFSFGGTRSIGGAGGFGSLSGFDDLAALTGTAIYNAITLISSSLALLDLYIAERMPDGSRRVARDHPAFDLVHSAFNDIQTSYIGRQTVFGHMALRGNGYLQVTRNKKGRPVALNIHDPRNIKVVVDERRNRVFYQLQRENQELSIRDVSHFKLLSYDGLSGLNPCTIMSRTLRLVVSREEWELAMLENGARPDGVLELPGVTNEIKAKEYRDSFSEIHGGPTGSGKVAVLWNGGKFTPTSFSPEQLQLTNARLFSIAEVGRIWNIPQHMLGNLERATFSNNEEQNLHLYQTCLAPLIVMIEQELNSKLFTRPERQRFTVWHDPASLLRANLVALTARDKSDLETGKCSINELRLRSGQTKLDHPNADKHWLPMNNLMAIEDQRPPEPVEDVDPDDASDEPFAESDGQDTERDQELDGFLETSLLEAIQRAQTREINTVTRLAKGKDPLAKIEAHYADRSAVGKIVAASTAVARHALKFDGLTTGAAIDTCHDLQDEVVGLVKSSSPADLPAALDRLFATRTTDTTRAKIRELLRLT